MTTKTANEVMFSEYHYLGNSPNGQNLGNYDELEQWFVNAGLTLKEDDFTFLAYSLETSKGDYTLNHRGVTIRYRVHPHRNTQRNPQFGYCTNVTYTQL
jgi:hypothetical protein